MMDIVITTNSPGELCSWVKSTVEKLKLKEKRVRIVVMLVPCPFASGKETKIAMGFSQVDIVLSPREYMAYCLGLPVPKFVPSSAGVVVFLGGDHWHALLAAKRLGFPAVAYTARPSSWGKYFEVICVADEKIKRLLRAKGVSEEKIRVIGNLIVEGVRPTLSREEALSRFALDPQALTVGLLPGSRIYHVRQSLPVFMEVAQQIASKMNGIQFLLGLSPFIEVGDLKGCLNSHSRTGIRGTSGELSCGANGWEIRTTEGTRIHIFEGMQYDLMNLSDLALTIPGTNTAELASLGKPMVVVYTWRASIPKGGLGVVLGILPLQSSLRRAVAHLIFNKMRFAALPNLQADREIVPEIRLEKNAEEITMAAIELLCNEEKRLAMGSDLQAIMGSDGASDRMADAILGCLRG